MRKIIIAALGVALVHGGALRADQARVAEPVSFALAPESWNRQDPADSIYRAARDAMNRGEHVRAADLFRRIWERHARSTYAPDAPYWEAFNRYRTGQSADLRRALESLAVQRERWARAATRESGDAEALAARIRGQQARGGDEQAARELMALAGEAAGVVMGPALAAAQEALASMDVQAITAEAMAAASEGLRAAGVALEGIGLGSARVPEQCRDEVELQTAALNALIHMNADRAMPVLKQVMARRDECSPSLRRRAVYLIADKDMPESVDLLLAAARNDPDLDVRRQAVFWLSEVDDPRAVPALEQFLNEAGDDQLRERAVYALSQHDDPRARQILRRVVQDARMPANVRGRAIFWLGEEGGAEDIAFLRGQFGRTGSAELDERIIRGVSQAGGRENAQWLMSVAGNAQVNIELRKKAVFWAAEAGVPAAELGALYDRIQDRQMKERILYALSESDEPAALDRLIRIARTEKDTALRKRAIFWLGHSSDPRAAEVLMDLITNPRGGG
ncbi:MAG TPA: HEAT repeat domain-containing protein [Longimicrobiales bacterium]|nr:HEAT repeat domain-containing protein [Longimicrobiales bacterium]